MTDVSHTVTQSALEAFAREYLDGLGAAIRENRSRWEIRLPSHVDVDFSDRQEFEINLAEEPRDETEDSVKHLTPESEFTQQLLDEAAEIANIGQLALTESMTERDYREPLWIVESDVELEDAAFSPYYDRTAICVFVRIDVETVSEYQTQFLEAVTIDVESRDQLPGVMEILVEEFFSPKAEWRDDIIVGSNLSDVTVAPERLAEVIFAGQEAVVGGVQKEFDEIRQSASRAADSEFAEYRQLQEQRITDNRTEIDSTTKRLEKLSSNIDAADSQQQRIEALEKRQELKAEREVLEADLEELLQEKEQGYAQKRQEIYRRHSIEVHTKPAALTFVTYERGEIEFIVAENDRSAAISVAYAIGAGVTDEVRCENCNTQLSAENPISLVSGRLGCQSCQ